MALRAVVEWYQYNGLGCGIVIGRIRTVTYWYRPRSVTGKARCALAILRGETGTFHGFAQGVEEYIVPGGG